MLFGIGTKVKFLHSGDEGIVKKMLGDGIIEVYLEADDMTIPAYEGDLIKAEAWASSLLESSNIPESVVTKNVSLNINIDNQIIAVNDIDGVQLLFAPQMKQNGLTDYYEMYFVNGTEKDLIFGLKLLLNHETADEWSSKVERQQHEYLGKLFYDELNDTPQFEIRLQTISTAGKGDEVKQQIRLKPKQFFKNQRYFSSFDKVMHWYLILASFQENKPKTSEDLKTYTQKNVSPVKFRRKHQSYITSNSVAEYAAFNPEIDLHIEKLVGTKKLTHAKILMIQMDRFETFLSKAIQLGIPKVFVIHGVGKGKLKNRIASYLMQHPEVQTFKNEYHPKYGWGATEVIL